MDFGKVSNLEEIDFSLPSLDQFLFKKNDSKNLALFLGATGWSMPSWKGYLYPKKTPQNAFATEYSKQFSTIEFNTTYYQIPPDHLVKRWYEVTEADFVFCPKMFQGISQSNSIGMGSAVLPDFIHRMSLLEEKLGMIFMQMPQSFSVSKFQALENFCNHWNRGIPLSIELRHPDYFSKEHKKLAAQLFSHSNISWLITDVAGRRDVSHEYLTAPFTCIRFVANDDETDLPRINQWIKRLLQWEQNGITVVYFFIHVPDNKKPYELCHYMASEWAKQSGHAIKSPQLIKPPQTLFE